MIRTITIKGRTGLFDVPSFLLSENDDLKIKFDFKDELRVGRFRVVVRHGEEKQVFTLAKTEPIELRAEWLKNSPENVEFSLVLLNATETAVIKDDYQIEPLKLETVDGNFTFSGLVQKLVERQDAQERALSLLAKRVEEYETNGIELAFEDE